MTKPRTESLQLGMDYSTAQARIRKLLLFHFVQKLALDTCFRCGLKITIPKEFSVDHKVQWLFSPNPTQLFYDLDNIAFSHLGCNSRESRYLGPPSDKEGVRLRANAHKRAIYATTKSQKPWLKKYSPSKRHEKYLKHKLKGMA